LSPVGLAVAISLELAIILVVEAAGVFCLVADSL
jgi:hypothetical protein